MPLAEKIAGVRTTLSIAGTRISQRQTKAHLGYIGAHSGRNLGDDAMFDAAVQLFPDQTIDTFDESWHEKRLASLGLGGKRYFQAAFLGGGTLISPFWAGKVRIALKQNLPVSTLGTGAGSCGFVQPDDVDLREWKPMLADFHRLGVRGPLSQAKIAELGVSHATVIGDLAFVLARDKTVAPSDPPRVAVNISLPREHECDFGEAEKLRELEVALPRLLEAGWQIVPFAMNKIDVPPMQSLLAAVGQAHLPVPIVRSFDELFDLLSPCAFTIAVRLHAAILSCCVGVPPLMLAYRDKCLDFMMTMEMEQWNISLTQAKPGQIIEKSLRLAEEWPQVRPPVLSRALHWKQVIEGYAADTLASAKG